MFGLIHDARWWICELIDIGESKVVPKEQVAFDVLERVGGSEERGVESVELADLLQILHDDWILETAHILTKPELQVSIIHHQLAVRTIPYFLFFAFFVNATNRVVSDVSD
jgi:hypothetical protein